jgi:hypothetical protein
MNNPSKNQIEDDDESLEEEYFDLETQTLYAYKFFTDPNSSKFAFRWSLFMNIIVILTITFNILETVDGPNHYTGLDDMASYNSLPNAYVSITYIYFINPMYIFNNI